MSAPIKCRQCGEPAEEARECYATPICYACLPPPEPLPIREVHPVCSICRRRHGLEIIHACE